jgi:hypothetical protein
MSLYLALVRSVIRDKLRNFFVASNAVILQNFPHSRVRDIARVVRKDVDVNDLLRLFALNGSEA